MGWTGWATVVGWAGWAFAHPIYIIVIIDVERLYPNAIIIEENYDGFGSAYLGWTGWAGWVFTHPTEGLCIRMGRSWATKIAGKGLLHNAIFIKEDDDGYDSACTSNSTCGALEGGLGGQDENLPTQFT